jgi:hypothetical protein
MTQRPTSIFVIALTKAFLAAGCGNDSGSADRESAGTGGVVASGGVFTGGGFGGGGVAATGGTTPLGTGGIVATGGALGTGGTAGAGGSPATGGAGGVGGIDTGGTGPTGDAGSGGSVGSAFPPVPYGTLTGPYTPVTITSTGPSNGYNVYHPQELGEDGLKHPVLTWGNGATTTPDNYPLLPALASHGFVVIAARSSFVTGTLLKDGLDWMLAQDSAAGPFQGNLDGERVLDAPGEAFDTFVARTVQSLRAQHVVRDVERGHHRDAIEAHHLPSLADRLHLAIEQACRRVERIYLVDAAAHLIVLVENLHHDRRAGRLCAAGCGGHLVLLE